MREAKSYLSHVIHNGANFKGRASRKEALLASLCLLFAVIVVPFGVVEYGCYGSPWGECNYITWGLAVVMSFMFISIFTICFVSMGVRRLHDLGLSGSWLLVMAIPYAIPLVIMALCMWPGVPGDTPYGSEPWRPTNKSK